MKNCNKCGVRKRFKDFFKDKNNKTDGHYSICKACKKVSTYGWRDKNRDIYNSGMREYRKNNYQKLRLQRYKLTLDQHKQMMSDQKGLCAICSKNPPLTTKRPLAVDHCHATGKVRGLLCYGCNRAIHILESPDLLASAQAYLLKYS